MSKFNDFIKTITAKDDYVNPVEYIGKEDIDVEKFKENADFNKNICKIFQDDKLKEEFNKLINSLIDSIKGIKISDKKDLIKIYELAERTLTLIFKLDRQYFSKKNNVSYFKTILFKLIRENLNNINEETSTNMSNKIQEFVQSNYMGKDDLSLSTFLEYVKLIVDLYTNDREAFNKFFNTQALNLKINSIEAWYQICEPIYTKYMYFLNLPYQSITEDEKSEFVKEVNSAYDKLIYDIQHGLRNLYILYEDNKHVPVNVSVCVIGGTRGI